MKFAWSADIVLLTTALHIMEAPKGVSVLPWSLQIIALSYKNAWIYVFSNVWQCSQNLQKYVISIQLS